MFTRHRGPRPRRLRPVWSRPECTRGLPGALAASLGRPALCRHPGNGYTAGRSSRPSSGDADEHAMTEGPPRGSARNELAEAIARVERQLALLRSAEAIRAAEGRPQQGLRVLIGSTEDRLAVLKA